MRSEQNKQWLAFFCITCVVILSGSLSLHRFSQAAQPDSSTLARKQSYIIPSKYYEDEKKIDQWAAERNLSELLTLANEIERKYAGDVEAYTFLLAKIAKSLSSYDFGDKKQYLYPDLFAKKVLMNANSISVGLETEMVQQLEGELKYFYGLVPADEWPKDRVERVQHLRHLWNRVNGEIDRSFNFDDPRNRPIGNVCVPAPNYLCGIRPEDVKEPAIRKQYVKLIEANTKKGQRYNSQIQLHRIDKRLKKLVAQFLISIYSRPPLDINELERELKYFNIGDSENERIMNSVKGGLPKE